MKAFLITVAILIVIVVGVDIAGRAVAEKEAGSAIARSADLQAAPDVAIHGFSFLAQALPGHYSHITVVDHDFPVGNLGTADTTAELYDVDFPLSDAIKGNTDALVAHTVDLHADLPTAALTKAFTQANVSISSGAGGTIQLSTTITVAGVSVPVSADITASYRNGALKLSATRVTAAGLSSSVTDSLAAKLSVSVPLAGLLPFPVQTATVVTDGAHLVVSGQLTNVSGRQLR